MLFFKRKNKVKNKTTVLVAAITDTVACEIYKEILRTNNIPFVAKQEGAGGYIKIVTGGLLVTDKIYVNLEDAERAKQLYEAYLETEVDFVDSEVE